MRTLAFVLLLAVTASGCVIRAHGRVNPVASVLMTGVAVAAVSNAAVTVSAPPPPVAEVGYYGYARPGHVWVNGRHTWNGSLWVWQPGYYQAERTNHTWVQGSWEPRGNQYVYVDGHWAPQRTGYVYVDGYYDHSGNGYVWRTGRWESQRAGHVYVNGSWTSVNGRRTWNHGGWRPASPAPASATMRASGGVIVQ
jgi:hypothetical protein